MSAVSLPASSKIGPTVVATVPTLSPSPSPPLQPHGPHIPRTLSLESWLSSLAAVKISWVPWAERDQSEAEDCRCDQEVGSEGKGDNGSNWEGGALTVWSVSGGRTITRSMVFITTRQSSFRTRFRTVFSHTVAKSVRLQIQATGEARGKSTMPAPTEAPLSDGLGFPFPLRVLYSLAIQEIHERSQHTVCILSHRCPGIGGCIPCAPNLAQDVSHLSNAFINPHLEATHVPTVQPSLPPHGHWSNRSN